MNKVNQISVFLENKSGRLAELTRTLANHKINIRALCIAETIDYGVLRLIVNDPQATRIALTNAGFTVTSTEVLVVQMPDRPGALAEVVDALASQGINIEYVYAFVARSGEDAFVVFRLEQMAAAIKALSARGIRILSSEEVYSI